jgi:hypothetical protein
MAELLIKAVESWTHDKDTSKMTAEELVSHESRSRKGDVVVVRPDGWQWGREECLPNFIVVKVPGTMEENKFYESPVMSDALPLPDISTMTDEEKRAANRLGVYKPKILKFRKHALPIKSVDEIALEVRDLDNITPILLKIAITDKTKK